LVIGNGFDLEHGLPTKYKVYKSKFSFLKKLLIDSSFDIIEF